MAVFGSRHCCPPKMQQAMIILNQKRWAGHVLRMGHNRIPKQLFYKLKRFKDNLKDNMNALHMNLQQWEELTLNSTAWDTLLRKAEWSGMLRSSMLSVEAPTLICQLTYSLENVCERKVLSRVSYVNHLKTHHINQKQLYQSLIVLPSINMLLSTRFAYYHLDWHGSWWYTGLQSMLIHLIQSRIQSLCHICLKPETRQKSSQVRRRVWATLIWVR